MKKLFLLILISFNVFGYDLHGEPCGEYIINGKFTFTKTSSDFMLLNPKSDIEQFVSISNVPVEKSFEWEGNIISIRAKLIGGEKKKLEFINFIDYSLAQEAYKKPHELKREIACK